MRRDETFVHVAIRDFLKSKGWTLIAGQYPGGSDDELHIFNIFDPTLAKDESPDHRRHSYKKLVPDLIAFKNNILLAIEAKPEYSVSDKEKLEYLLSDRKIDFLEALKKFAKEKNQPDLLPVEKLKIIPVLAFLNELSPINRSDFSALKVIDLNEVIAENFSLE